MSEVTWLIVEHGIVVGRFSNKENRDDAFRKYISPNPKRSGYCTEYEVL